MAKKTNELEDAMAAPDAAPVVEMVKDGVKSGVHPSTVKAHEAAGWKVVNPEQLLEAVHELAVIASLEVETAELVEMSKDGKKAKVHPSTVKAHEAAGWKVG